MNDKTVVELDGRRVRLGKVPADRRTDVVMVVNGARVRPFRFCSGLADNPFTVVR